jgi:Domain of unknown function (DUF4421)
MKSLLTLVALIMLWMCVVQDGYTQASEEDKAKIDSTYIESFRGYLVGRIQLGRKTAGMNFNNNDDGYRLRYLPNKSINLGVGVTYKFATIKISTGIYQPNNTKGDTKDFDFQFHRYGRKYVMDFVAQFYKGFYLGDHRFAQPDQEYYVRPDVSVNAIGGSFQHVFNHRRFSYRAAFQQTEIQKKSAGSFFVGLELFMGRFMGDSTIVPSKLRESLSGDHSIRKMKFIEIGPNVGYAYTWVYRKFFVTTGASVSLNAGVNRFFDANGVNTFVGLSPNTVLRASTGYSVKQWGVNVLFLSTALHLPDFRANSVVVNTGMVRFNFVYRIAPSKKVQKYLKVVDKIDEKLP